MYFFSGSHDSFIKYLSGHHRKWIFYTFIYTAKIGWCLFMTSPCPHANGTASRTVLTSSCLMSRSSTTQSTTFVSPTSTSQRVLSPHVFQFLNRPSHRGPQRHVPSPHVPDSRIQPHSPRPNFSHRPQFNFLFTLTLHYILQTGSHLCGSWRLHHYWDNANGPSPAIVGECLAGRYVIEDGEKWDVLRLSAVILALVRFLWHWKSC